MDQMKDALGESPGNEKAPVTSEALRNTTGTTATRVYHSHETVPTPQQRIHPARGGYEVVAIDGYGLHLRAWRPYRYLIHDLLDRCGGRLTKAAADIVLGGRG